MWGLNNSVVSITMVSRYAELGVDVHKKGIEVFKAISHSLFPYAFCNVGEDPDLPGYGLTLHTDGAGSKPVISYLLWRETGSVEGYKNLAQDVLAMNIDDVACVGAKPIRFVDYVALNKFKVPREQVLDALSLGFSECLTHLKNHGLNVRFAGGETADLPDQLRTLDISGTVLGRVKLSEAVTGANVKPSNVIVGLGSGGKTRYEKAENSGIMCNGITLARKCLLKRDYAVKYPEVCDPEAKGYYGRFDVDTYVDEEDLGMTVGEALTSPTRIFTPVLIRVLEKYGSCITGLVHNTGGGMTKCLKLGRNVHYVKDAVISIEPIFRLIQKESHEDWRSMFEDFNMGIGFEIMLDVECVDEVLSLVEGFGLKAQVLGRCEAADGRNRLTIRSPFGVFNYEGS